MRRITIHKPDGRSARISTQDIIGYSPFPDGCLIHFLGKKKIMAENRYAAVNRPSFESNEEVLHPIRSLIEKGDI